MDDGLILTKSRSDATQRSDVTLAKKALADYSDIETKLKTVPVARPQTATTQTAAQQTGNTTNNPAQATAQTTANTPNNPLPKFVWSQDAASATKKLAVQLNLFKDKDTGMTAALKSIMTVRKAIDGMKDSLPGAKKIELMEKSIQVYDKFRMFVASKLRVLSRDPRWQGYCDSAADLAQQEIDDLRGRITILKGASGG